MTKKYKINGLDCPNCARSLEEELNKLSSIESAKIDFLKSTLQITSSNDLKALEDAKSLTKKLEPDAVIVSKSETKSSFKKSVLLSSALLLVGIALAIVVLTVKLPTWLYWTLFVTSALLMGYKTYYKALMLLLKGVINENFLVTLSVIGATCVGEGMDALMVIGLYSIGKILESIALNKSKKSIEELTTIQPEFAVIVSDGEERRVDPNEIKIGDIIVVRAGEKVAVDGIVTSGKVSLNTQSLTGESLPQQVEEGDEILSGSIVLDGVVYLRSTTIYRDSTVSKIMDMINNASDKKTKTETVISKISKYYTLGVIFLSICVWGIVWAVTKNVNEAIYRGLIFLVISCPCAFAISVPLAYFSGIGNASRNGILVKGSNYLDVLAKLELLAFDKTGTLTTGEFEISEVELLDKNLTEEDLIYIASLGEQFSTHPLAKAIVLKNTKKLEKPQNIKEVAGKGVYFEHNGDKYFVGRDGKSQENTAVEVLKNDKLIGIIKLQDSIKPSTKRALQQLREMGIKTAILSGDNEKIVESVANELGVDEFGAKLLPEDKFKWLEENKKSGKTIGYVGDGINDAPSLTLADVGISMGLSGSSASIEESDIVIANDNPQKIVDGIKISKVTRGIVWQNIIASALVKIVFLSLGAFGVTGMLSAVIADVGVTLLAILNSLRALRYNPNKQKIKHA